MGIGAIMKQTVLTALYNTWNCYLVGSRFVKILVFPYSLRSAFTFIYFNTCLGCLPLQSETLTSSSSLTSFSTSSVANGSFGKYFWKHLAGLWKAVVQECLTLISRDSPTHPLELGFEFGLQSRFITSLVDKSVDGPTPGGRKTFRCWKSLALWPPFLEVCINCLP